LSGAELMQIAPQLPPTALGAVATVLLPGMSLIRIEVIASANRQIARPDEAIAINMAVCRTWCGAQTGSARRAGSAAMQANSYLRLFISSATGHRLAVRRRRCAGIAGLLAIM
jgi:hypothetical protein